jgi:hypothetical protein
VLKFHTGRKNAVSRPAMLTYLKQLGFNLKDDRPMRAAINLLRKQGIEICSAGGENGGYWLAADHEELEEYIQRELHPRAMDLLEQEKALKAEAEKRWGRYSPEKQASLF